MLYSQWLKQYEISVNDSVESLFEKALHNQCYENDMLLVAVHGFYDERNLNFKQNGKIKFSPYSIGIGEEGLTNKTQHDFFMAFINGYLVNGDRTKFLEYQKTNEPQLDSYLITTQMELLLYLKFWESDYLMKQLYNICVRLLHGKHYDWHIQMKERGKKTLLDSDIKNGVKRRAPKFATLFDKIYSRQIRNAVAHSQFYLNNSYLILTNYDPTDGHNLKRLKLDEWEEMFHHFVLFYRFFSKQIIDYNTRSLMEAADKHFGKNVVITKMDGTSSIKWLKCLPEIPRWLWYDNWDKYNRHL